MYRLWCPRVFRWQIWKIIYPGHDHPTQRPPCRHPPRHLTFSIGVHHKDLVTWENQPWVSPIFRVVSGDYGKPCQWNAITELQLSKNDLCDHGFSIATSMPSFPKKSHDSGVDIKMWALLGSQGANSDSVSIKSIWYWYHMSRRNFWNVQFPCPLAYGGCVVEEQNGVDWTLSGSVWPALLPHRCCLRATAHSPHLGWNICPCSYVPCLSWKAPHTHRSWLHPGHALWSQGSLTSLIQESNRLWMFSSCPLEHLAKGQVHQIDVSRSYCEGRRFRSQLQNFFKLYLPNAGPMHWVEIDSSPAVNFQSEQSTSTLVEHTS